MSYGFTFIHVKREKKKKKNEIEGERGRDWNLAAIALFFLFLGWLRLRCMKAKNNTPVLVWQRMERGREERQRERMGWVTTHHTTTSHRTLLLIHSRSGIINCFFHTMPRITTTTSSHHSCPRSLFVAVVPLSFFCLLVCLFVCLCVCLFVCLSRPCLCLPLSLPHLSMPLPASVWWWRCAGSLCPFCLESKLCAWVDRVCRHGWEFEGVGWVS